MSFNVSIEETSSDHDWSSLIKYNRLLLKLYEGSNNDEAMAFALEKLRQTFNANYIALILRVANVEDVGLMLVAGDLPIRGQLTNMSYYKNLTPFLDQAVDKVFTHHDFMTDEEWVASEYYQTFCKQLDVYHVMGIDVSTKYDDVVRFRITRPKSAPAFNDKDKKLCEILLPHIREALYLRSALGRSESIGDLYADAINSLSVGTIVLNEKSQVTKVNEYARELLQKGDGLKLVGDRLEASYLNDNKQLQERIKQAFSAHLSGEEGASEPLSITRPSGEVGLGVVFRMLPDTGWTIDTGKGSLLLYVRDAVNKSSVSSAVAKELFDFTPAETALALELANGFSLEAASEKLGITRNTARAHLRAIFSKTGVRRQAELVRVILNSVASLSETIVGAERPERALIPTKLDSI